MAREKICGIYKITNLINGKVYIGQSNDIYKRWKEHKRISKVSESGSLLYRAFKKYGIENFSFEILEKCEPKDLDEREIFYIKKFNSYVGGNEGYGYNLTMGGYSHIGYFPTEKTRSIWRKSRKGEGNSRARPVICDGKRFGTVKECAAYYGVEKTSMQKWLNKKIGMPYAFIERGLRYENEEFSCKKQNRYHIVYDGKIFDSAKSFSKFIKFPCQKLLKYLKENKTIDCLVGHSLVVNGKIIY